MSDLLWSDPSGISKAFFGVTFSSDDFTGWGLSPRNTGFEFGVDITRQFMTVNNLSKICRAHQLVNEGYRWMFNEALITVWSAPNYCYRCGNVAAILEVDDSMNMEPKVFYTTTKPPEYSRKPCLPAYFF